MNDLGGKLTRTLERVRTATGVSLAFAGPVSKSGSVRLDYFAGRTVGLLAGVTLSPGQGLGGMVVATGKAMTVASYLDESTITHQYDRIIRGEGLRSMVAVPITFGRSPLAVVYGAYHNDCVAGDRVKDVLTREARALEQALAVGIGLGQRDSLDRDTLESDHLRLCDQVQDAHRELRLLAATVDDASLRSAILEVTARLADRGAPTPAIAPDTLTPREIDVLTIAASGASNSQIAAVLDLQLSTVKSYMKSILAKTGTTTRMGAVIAARRSGIVP